MGDIVDTTVAACSFKTLVSAVTVASSKSRQYDSSGKSHSALYLWGFGLVFAVSFTLLIWLLWSDLQQTVNKK